MLIVNKTGKIFSRTDSYIFNLELEIRDSQNLAKLGLGGKPSFVL